MRFVRQKCYHKYVPHKTLRSPLKTIHWIVFFTLSFDPRSISTRHKIKRQSVCFRLSFYGGDEGGRTPYLLNAIQALYQVSYTPKCKWYFNLFHERCQSNLQYSCTTAYSFVSIIGLRLVLIPKFNIFFLVNFTILMLIFCVSITCD